jgi:hypothetical protein
MENAMATERDDESDSLDEGEAGFARAPARGLLWWGARRSRGNRSRGMGEGRNEESGSTENDPTAVSVV